MTAAADGHGGLLPDYNSIVSFTPAPLPRPALCIPTFPPVAAVRVLRVLHGFRGSAKWELVFEAAGFRHGERGVKGIAPTQGRTQTHKDDSHLQLEATVDVSRVSGTSAEN